MRRRVAPPGLRVDPAAAPPIAGLAPGPQGLRLRRVETPAGFQPDPIHELSPVRASPFPAARVDVVSGGRMVLLGTAGIAASMNVGDMGVVHDRRPPGIDAIIGATLANAGLLRVEGVWRAVVLPSIGDLATDIGTGPAAIRPDGSRVAAVDGGMVRERALPEGLVIEEAGGTPDALAYASDGSLLAATGGVLHRPGEAGGDGPAVLTLVAAAAAHRAATMDAEGEIVVWDTENLIPLSRHAAPEGDLILTGISAGGDMLVLSASDQPPAVAFLRASNGRLAAWIEGARGGAVLPDDRGIIVTGDAGTVHLSRPRDSR